MPHFCVNAVVATLLKDYVQRPCYDELLDEINTHKYVELRLGCDGFLFNPGEGSWYAITHVTSDAVVIQEVEMTAGMKRFAVHVVQCEDWNDVFIHWIDEDHDRYFDCNWAWETGMHMYGAQ